MVVDVEGLGDIEYRGGEATFDDVSYSYDGEAKALDAKVMRLIAVAGIEIGTYGTPGDMGCDYGWGSKIHINFEDCRDKEKAA